MEIAGGMLGWSPYDFWGATPHEFTATLNGYMERHGLKTIKAMSRGRLDKLLKAYPDTPQENKPIPG